MDGGAWWAAVHGVSKSQTRLRDFTFTFHLPALEKAMATHSSVLAWRIPGKGEPCGLPSMGSHRVGHDWSDLAVVVSFLLTISYSLMGRLAFPRALSLPLAHWRKRRYVYWNHDQQAGRTGMLMTQIRFIVTSEGWIRRPNQSTWAEMNGRKSTKYVTEVWENTRQPGIQVN